ncbi:MAG TPA: ABC transporter permease [Gemmatimonadaceae bacterium]
MDTLRQDLRFTIRSLLRHPGFACVAVLVLALGIGATTAVFSVVNAVLLRPLPYRDPVRLVAVSGVHETSRASKTSPTVPLTDVALWRTAGIRAIESIGAFAYTQLPVRVDKQAFSPVTALVDPEFLPTIGVAPAKGSYFDSRLPGGAAPNDHTVIVSHRFWVEAFGADPNVVGRAVSVDGDAFSVRGVMPADFQFPRGDASYFTQPIDLVVPSAAFAGFPPQARQWWSVARLARGVALVQAQADLAAVALNVARDAGGTPDWSARLEPLAEVTARHARPALIVTLAIALVLLLIAATNVMNLLFSRGVTRLQEMAIRTAIGCSTGRLIRQLMMESACLAFVSGALGVVLAAITTDTLVALAPVHLPVTAHIGIDRSVLAFTVLVCAATAAIAGVFPALRAGGDTDAAVRSGGTRTTGTRALGRIQGALCVAQMALGVALLSVAASLTGGLTRLAHTDPGFRADSVLGFSLSVPDDHPMDVRKRFFQAALDDIRAIPGVTDAGFITFLPPEPRAGVFMGVTIGGAPELQKDEAPRVANTLIASPGYLATVGLHLVAGRDINDGDAAGAPPVIMVNAAFAKQYFPGRDAVGQHIGTGFDGSQPTREVVGVIADSHDRGLNRAAIPTVYVPFQQFALGYGSIAVRAHVAPATLVPEIRRRLSRLDPSVPLTGFQTLGVRIHDSLDEPRFYSLMATVCAAMAILFVTLGLYGLVSLSVARRVPEFGIRMAIGASGGRILATVLAQGLRMAVLGSAIGAGAALAAARVLRALPFTTEPMSVATLGGAAALVIVVTLVASFVPARRASRVSPLAALRYD